MVSLICTTTADASRLYISNYIIGDNADPNKTFEYFSRMVFTVPFATLLFLILRNLYSIAVSVLAALTAEVAAGTPSTIPKRYRRARTEKKTISVPAPMVMTLTSSNFLNPTLTSMTSTIRSTPGRFSAFPSSVSMTGRI